MDTKKKFDIFLSLVVVVRNRSASLRTLAESMTNALSGLVADYEIIFVDNASMDDSIAQLKSLTSASGLPNLQVFALTKEVDADTASWAGMENALGDFVAVIDPATDDIAFLPTMLDQAVSGTDVVFARNESVAKQSMIYRAVSYCFNCFYRAIFKVDLAREAPQFRLLSKRVVNFILQHPMPTISYRHLPATAGFAKLTLSYSSPKPGHRKHLGESINRGMRLLVSTTQLPMRLVTGLSLFGAIANVIYCIYIVGVAIWRTDVAPGWITLSLQQSGMFFLISLVLLVLGEYILHMAQLSNEGPLYHVAQEFTSATMTRRLKLNIEEARSREAA
ncbi:MAG: glycosyl transferase [Burkholderiales bacterium 12-64-5]|nr:MAG: glycosyl transferase [Burkholderiales bacterium 12-64-5]